MRKERERMIRQKNISSWLGKLLLVILTLFSQFHIPLEVLAEEIEKMDENTTIVDDSGGSNEEIKQDEEKNTDTVVESADSKKDSINDNQGNTDDKKDDVIEKQSNTGENQDNTDNSNSKQDEVLRTNEANTENKDVVGKYVVTINGEEVTDYTVSDNKVLNIKQTYDGEDGTYKFLNDNEVIDLSHAIYGDYEFTYTVVSSDDESNILGEVKIVIHYNGDNSELLNEYTDLSYSDGSYSIRGKDTKLTVKDVIDSFDNSINSAYYVIYKSTSNGESWHYISVSVVDSDNNYMAIDDEITSSSKILFGLSYVNSLYSIKIEGDYTDDGIVDIEDAKALVDKILNGEEYDIVDATNSVFTTGIWDNSLLPSDSLSNSLSSKSEVYQGEEFDVKYYINGFDKDTLNGISGIINYDKNIVQLVGIESSSIYGNYNDNGEFAYLFDNFNSNDVLLTFKFKGIQPGTANISIDDIVASNGSILDLDGDSIETSVEVLELPKGGDVEEESNDSSDNSNTSNSVATTNDGVVNTTNNIISGVYIPRYVALSSDNYIKSLTIDGYKIDFDMYKYEYSIKVKNSVTSLKLNVVLNDPSATYEIKGNENFKVGENVVEIVVKAENGDTRTYTIKVEREKKKGDVFKKVNDGSAKPVIIVLILLVIAGLIYVIFKDDEEEKKNK